MFAKGTFGANPFRIEDGKAYGPGALDMKGGIVISLYVIKALESIGFNEHPIKVIYVSDEEIGHRNSSGSDLYLKEGEGGICAFNMETGLVDGRLCGKKGGGVRPLCGHRRGIPRGNDSPGPQRHRGDGL